MKVAYKNFLAVAVVSGAVLLSTQHQASATDPVVQSTHLESFSDALPNGTDMFQHFNCQSGNAVLSGVAYMQIGSSIPVSLDVLDYEADTYPDGIVVHLFNDSGIDQYYRVTMICGTEG
jgi:hypothetical protein